MKYLRIHFGNVKLDLSSEEIDVEKLFHQIMQTKTNGNQWHYFIKEKNAINIAQITRIEILEF